MQKKAGVEQKRNKMPDTSAVDCSTGGAIIAPSGSAESSLKTTPSQKRVKAE